MKTKYPWRQNVRFDPTMGEHGTFMLRCEHCALRHEGSTFWPLTLEFWNPAAGLQRCRSCYNYRRRKQRSQSIEAQRARMRARYWANRDAHLAKRRTYYAKNSEWINAKHRAAYAAKRVADEQS